MLSVFNKCLFNREPKEWMNKEDRRAGGRAREAIINSTFVACSKLCVIGGQLAQGPWWKGMINEGSDELHSCWKGLSRVAVIWHPWGAWDDGEHTLIQTELLTLWKIVMRIQSDLDKWEKQTLPNWMKLCADRNEWPWLKNWAGGGGDLMTEVSGLQQKHQLLGAGHNVNDFPSVWAMFQYWPAAEPCDIGLLIIPTYRWENS